jgi:anti-sigma factor RsiW
MTHPGSAKLQRYTLGELSAEARLAVDGHLANCPRCRQLVEEERQLDELIIGSLGGTPTATDAELSDAASLVLQDDTDLLAGSR